MCVDINVSVYSIYSLAMPMKGFRNKDITKAMNKLKAESWLLSTTKTQVSLESRKVPDDPGTSFRPESEVLKEA